MLDFRSISTRRVRTAAGSNAGIAAVEFAFLAPVFLVLLMGSVDIGQLLYNYYQLDQAVAAGAQYAALNATNVTSTNGAALANSIATVVASANGSGWANDTVVVNNGPWVSYTSGRSTSGGTAANADSCYCPTGSPLSWGSSMSCGAACTGSGQSGKFVTVTASYNYSPIFALIGSSSLTQSAVVQAR